MSQLPSIVLSVLGFITLSVLSYKFISFVNLYFFTPSQLSKYLSSSPEEGKSWALVTGASDGIGLETVRLLYAKGFNVVMHARNAEKLQGLADKIQSERPDIDGEIQIVAALATEAAKGTDTVAEHIQTKLKGGRLRVLVNNVGYGKCGVHRVYHLLEEITPDGVSQTANLNALFPALLTSKLLPTMRRPPGAALTEKEDNVPCLILNMGSMAGQTGMPYIATYSASKSFNRSFSYALSAEMALTKAPVEVLCILIADVFTGNNNLTSPSFFTLTAPEMAIDILNRVGCGFPVVVGNWRQALQAGLLDYIPGFALDASVKGIMLDRRIKEDKTI
jgi:17beta-estradiol 17-dehydrogenase / very-long-chain 3-oxoacyl-CoA reductase